MDRGELLTRDARRASRGLCSISCSVFNARPGSRSSTWIHRSSRSRRVSDAFGVSGTKSATLLRSLRGLCSIGLLPGGLTWMPPSGPMLRLSYPGRNMTVQRTPRPAALGLSSGQRKGRRPAEIYDPRSRRGGYGAQPPYERIENEALSWPTLEGTAVTEGVLGSSDLITCVRELAKAIAS